MGKLFTETEVRKALREYGGDEAETLASVFGISLGPAEVTLTEKFSLDGSSMWVGTGWEGQRQILEVFPNYHNKFFKITIKEILT